MARVPLVVTFEDGTNETITPTPLAMIGWEKWSGRKMSDLGSEGGGMGMGDMVRMAWEQAQLMGKTTLPFEAWAATLDDINPEGDAETVDPTSAEVSTVP